MSLMPELLNLLNYTDQTLLNWTCRKGNMALVRLLLNFRANQSVSTITGRTLELKAQTKRS